MKTTITTAFAALLLASASTAALAQDPNSRHDNPASAVDHPHAMGEQGSQWQGRGAPRQQAPQQPPQRTAPQPSAAPVAPTTPGVRGQQPNGGDHRDHGQGGTPPVVGSPPAVGAPQRNGQGYRNSGRDNGDHRDFRDGGGRDDRDGSARNGRDGDQRYGEHRDWVRGQGRDDDRAWDPRRGQRPPNWAQGRYPSVYGSPRRFHSDRYYAPRGFFVRSWAFGDVLPRGWYGDDYRIGEFWEYGLPYPPPGYDWVRVDDDAFLIDSFTGRIAQVVRNLFY